MFSCTSDAGAVTAVGGSVGCLCHSPGIRRLTQRVNEDLSRRGFMAGLAAAAASLGLASPVAAQPMSVRQARPILLTNFRLFDGTSAGLRDGLRLLIEGTRIKAVSGGNPSAPDGAQVIDCGRRVVMPGLIDAHWHSLLAGLPMQSLLTGDVGYINLAASAEAERTLLRGFTTVRDLGGPVFALKQAIDEGLMPGPRIYPSGAMITTTGGHGDLRSLSDLPRNPGGGLSVVERIGGAAIADAMGEVQMRTREQLMQGASQIKIVGGGGVSSPRSPLDMSTFSEVDLRAAVAVAEDWNTYVTVHAYAPGTIRRAITAGAKCIEHAHLMDEPTARMMADRGVWLSIQPFIGEEDSVPLVGPGLQRLRQVIASTGAAYGLAKSHRIKTAFGSDMLFSAEKAARQGVMLTHLTRWYANAEILMMATSVNAELLALSGPRNPYPGKVGVIEAGAMADLLVVDGNPLEDIALIANPDRHLSLIMKDGIIRKNILNP